MSMLHGRQRGKNRSLDGTIIRNESDNKLQEGTKLHELGKRFEADKAKLEKEITKVQNAKISEADKKNLIAELEGGIALLQEQYDKEVAEEEAKIQEELEGQIESMQEAADEFEKQADSLKNVQMDVASKDTSAAAEAAESKKKEFETMKSNYVEKLKLQMEQAETQRRNIRNRRLSGK